MFTLLNLKSVASCSLSALLLLDPGFATGSGDPFVWRSEIGATAREAAWTLDEILGAMRLIESGGEPDGGRNAVGDRGGAIGPFQIHRPYWQDAEVSGTYEDCRDLQYASSVVVAYWRRYCPQALQALDAEILARVHNGGPNGHREKSTQPFWRKVERELLKRRATSEARPFGPA